MKAKTMRKFYPLIFSVSGVFLLIAFQNCGPVNNTSMKFSAYNKVENGPESLGNASTDTDTEDPDRTPDDEIDDTPDNPDDTAPSDIGICFLTRAPQKLTSDEINNRAQSELDLDDEEMDDFDSDFNSSDHARKNEVRFANREEAEVLAGESDVDDTGALPINSGLPNVVRLTKFKQGKPIMIGLRQLGPCGYLRANGQWPPGCASFDHDSLRQARLFVRNQKFIAPHGRRICMRENTCRGLVNQHLRATDGVLFAQMLSSSESSNSEKTYVTWKERYRRNKKTGKPVRDYCKETMRNGQPVIKRIYEHPEVVAELNKLDQVWAKLQELGLAP